MKKAANKFDPMDFALLSKIASRGHDLAVKYGHGNHDAYQAVAIMATIGVAHSYRPLRLADMLAADDGNFGHDVFGIIKHFDPITDTYKDCFVPRFQVRQEAA